MADVYSSTVIKANLDVVWNEIRDFGDLAQWHPLIVSCFIENDEPSEKVGCIRNFNLEDGSNFREQLIALNDFKMTFSYSIVSSPLPITNYRATVKLVKVTDGDHTFAQWFSTFDTPPESKEEIQNLVRDAVYQKGFDSLKTRLEPQ